MLVIALLTGLLLGLGAPEHAGKRASSEHGSAIARSESSRRSDGWLQRVVASAGVARAAVAERLPAVAEDADSRRRTETRRFSLAFVARPATSGAARVVVRRRILRMDSGEPPSSALFAA